MSKFQAEQPISDNCKTGKCNCTTGKTTCRINETICSAPLYIIHTDEKKKNCTPTEVLHFKKRTGMNPKK